MLEHRLTPILCFLVLAAVVAAPALAGAGADELPESVTFSEHVAPVFMEHCATCHRPGDVAPMSLLSYDTARPWAKSIRRAVLAREMPPWDADPRYGDFANDISLNDREIALIARWVDQGAREGNPAAMPPPPELGEPGSWRMGRAPDLIVELAPVDVPAAGPDLFVTQVYGMDLPPGKWVQAIELLPGNTEVLHHVVTYLGPFGMGDDEEEESNAGVNRVLYLNEAARRPPKMAEAPRVGAVWVAGSPPAEFPPGMGHPLDTDQLVSLNIHYHPSGSAGTDVSKLGLYLGKGEMEKEITTAFAADPGMYIPAGAAGHREEAVYLFSQDSHILSLLPHMHQRGKSMRYTLTRPGEEPVILLDVPEYDYDWQNIYHYREPVPVPAGSLLQVEATWDNSADNPANPDPEVDVPWGDGTNNEMLVAFLDFIVDEGKKPSPVRISDKIAQLLERHPPEWSYTVVPEGMGFGGDWGLVLPPEGEGTFYLAFGHLMFSTSIREIHRLDDGELAFTGAIITSGGGTRSPIGFLAKRHDDGTIGGEVFFGREIDGDNAGELRGKGRPFAGRNRLSAAAAATGGS